MVREEWFQKSETGVDILSYAMNVRNRMEKATQIVEENARADQTRQKAYYDQKAQVLNIQPQDEVLLLLPSSTKKFLAHWQGPYVVTR